MSLICSAKAMNECTERERELRPPACSTTSLPHKHPAELSSNFSSSSSCSLYEKTIRIYSLIYVLSLQRSEKCLLTPISFYSLSLLCSQSFSVRKLLLVSTNRRRKKGRNISQVADAFLSLAVCTIQCSSGLDMLSMRIAI